MVETIFCKREAHSGKLPLRLWIDEAAKNGIERARERARHYSHLTQTFDKICANKSVAAAVAVVVKVILFVDRDSTVSPASSLYLMGPEMKRHFKVIMMSLVPT